MKEFVTNYHMSVETIFGSIEEPIAIAMLETTDVPCVTMGDALFTYTDVDHVWGCGPLGWAAHGTSGVSPPLMSVGAHSFGEYRSSYGAERKPVKLTPTGDMSIAKGMAASASETGSEVETKVATMN